MGVFCPWLLLILEYLALSDARVWTVEHPNTLYAWEGACIWIPCKYKIPRADARLENIFLYQNFWYDNVTKDFMGTTLYKDTETQRLPRQYDRVMFLGDTKNNCTLKIDRIHVNDSGQVGLRMTSGQDKWMEEIHLNVSKTPFPPYIQLPPEIRESQEVTLTCRLNFTCFGYHIQLQWSLEGTSTVTSTILSPKSVYTESKLTFQPVWTDHGKNVTCQVKNSDQVLSEDTVQLDVKHTPKLTIEVSPKEAAVMEKDSVTITCQVTSSNPKYETVSWFKDGNPLQGETVLTLTLPEVTKDMSGRYQCQASNEMGQGESEEVTLTVLFPPEPSKVQIPHSPAEEGKSIELICISLASPRATNYTWYHNGKKLPGRTQEKFQIPRVFLWHAGNYSCLAENSLGPGQIGEETELDVQYAPKNVTTVIQGSAPIREGDSVTLFCSYASSNPAVTRYQWNVRGSSDEPRPGVLKIQKVAWDATPIKCAACNHWCSWATPVNLNVHYAPRNVKVLTISHQPEIHTGHHVILQCTFSESYPKEVRYFWKKNGSLVREGRDLNFNSISPEDAGDYNCVVNNSIGQTPSQDLRLQVLYAPRRLRVSISPGDGVMEGRKAVLTCESEANPPIFQYAWFDQNNQDLYYSGQKLRLEPLKIQHSGSYRCQGTNRLGTGMSPPSTLTVYYSPKTIGKRTALGLGFCLGIIILTFWAVKLQKKWKRTQSQQGLQENSSGQSFFVRNKKARRTPASEGPQSLGCYNPVMDDSVSYAILRFPEDGTPSAGDARTSATQGPLPNNDTVTYSVLQRRHVGDYENVTPNSPEDESIHYSELVQFGAGERPPAKEDVEYVTLKH